MHLLRLAVEVLQANRETCTAVRFLAVEEETITLGRSSVGECIVPGAMQAYACC